MPINSKFVDVDFSKQGRPTGDLGGRLPLDATKFKDALRTMSKDELIAVATDANYTGCENLITRIYDQNGDPSCTSNATLQAHQIIQAVQFGKENVVQLSQLSLYKRVGTARSGSSVSGNLRELNERGALPLDIEANRGKYKHLGPEAKYNNYKLPSGWEETGKLFRGFEYFDVEGMQQFYTALAMGLPVVYGRSGHCICAVRLIYENGKFIRKYANSWSVEWGDGGGDFDGGFGYDSERAGGASWAFALRAVTVNTDQGPPA